LSTQQESIKNAVERFEREQARLDGIIAAQRAKVLKAELMMTTIGLCLVGLFVVGIFGLIVASVIAAIIA